ncbi:MAG: 23S rRNA (pseudouridine(1915)-N(3))-methyltransferase RlmH [Hyphococcus sp.]
MRISIAAIGVKSRGPETDIAKEYLNRANALGRNLGFSGFDLKTFDAPRGVDGVLRQQHESEALSAAANGARLVALDENGKNLSSADFTAWLSRQRDDGAPGALFAIGGADGHHASLLANAAMKLAFGAATWPHMLVRAMLAEQIYRSMTILSGHPYHRS